MRWAAVEAQVTPIAVIGMGCRLPGHIDSPDLFWEALLRGDDLVTKIPPDRWDADEYYDPEPGVPGRAVSKWCASLDDVAGFDHEFFGIGEREATAIDPQHRLLLETAWEAVEHAGLDPGSLAGSLTGVFVGLTHDDYTLRAADAQALEEPYGFVATSFSMGSGRIAYALGVHGPAVTVDTACSSGLTSVHMACRSLHQGECDLALAGGASVSLDPRKHVAGSALGLQSATGRCHVFDVAADGFVGGEGSVVLLLKRLSDALRDGDQIRAVVRGTASNQDGRTVNIATPSLTAQVAAYQAALAAAGVNARTVGMVEAHGTGTPVGDRIEYASLARVYGIDGPCAVGSAKTNFGHIQSAAGTLGLMKAVLAVQHGEILRNLHFTRLPDDLARIDTQLFVPRTTTLWPNNGHEAPRRAAVSSYGMSGTNVHAIVEQPPDAVAAHSGSARPGIAAPLLFALSSTSHDGLRQTSARLADWVQEHAESVAPSDLAYTLARRRAHRPVRKAVIANGLEQLTASLREIADDETAHQAAVGQDDRGPVWVFSGQGSQWVSMGAELLANEPVFAGIVAELEPLIAAESGFSVREAMTAPQIPTGIDRVQPTIFAMQVALAATMRSYGVRPGAVIGHSLGEVAAAVVAQALSLADGVRVICRRSRLLSRIAGAGAMASVELPAQEVFSELKARGIDDVVVSVVPSPQSTVIGGATETVRELIAMWERRGVMAREVSVDVASHSPQVDPILDQLAEDLAELTPLPPEVPYYSATQYDPHERPACDAGYWVRNLRQMVRFSAAVRAALEDGYRVFAELAPHPLLTHAVERTAGSLDMPVAALAGMRREQPLPYGMRGLLADLYSAGAAVDFSVPYPVGRLVDSPLPAWTHVPLLYGRKGRDQQAQHVCTVSVHPLLGAHVRLPKEPERHVWQAELGTAAHPWLTDHQIHRVATLPGAAYCEMALAAARQLLGDTSEVTDIRFERTLLLDKKTPASALASIASPGVFNFVVEADQNGDFGRQASALLHASGRENEPPAHDLAALLAAHPHRLDGVQLREGLNSVGVQFGPAFTGLIAVHTAETTGRTVLAEVGLPAPIRSQQGAYRIHPALLDACFQSLAAHPTVHSASGGGGLTLPLGARRLRAHHPTRYARYCLTRVTKVDAIGVEADLDIFDEHGTVLLSVQGLQLGSGVSESGNRDRVLSKRLVAIDWEQQTLPELTQADPTAWLLINICDAADPLAPRLAEALMGHGEKCTTIFWPPGVGHPVDPGQLASHLGASAFDGVVVVTAAPESDPDARCVQRGLEQVRQLVGIARELPEAPGEPPRLYVVTRQAQTVLPGDVTHLEQGGLRGLMRVIGAEQPHVRATQIDVDDDMDAELLAHQLLVGSEEDETSWRKGNWYTARMCPAPLRPEERRTTVVDHQRDGMRLQIRVPGDLQTMELTAFDRVPPGPGQIEVAVSASSVNFADVLTRFGRYPTFDGRMPQLGTDFAGVVTAVGPGVTDFQVGDHIGGPSGNGDGCWATFVICDARLAVQIPPALTDGQAAAVLTAYATAWYSLHELARISSRDKVLIHSATGGVGQAAIAIARWAGAEIFATAGSPERRALLRDMGIEHVYHSRSTEFAEQIRHDTNGYGVDIVLNSLPGAAQCAGLELLAFGGRFVEIGKRDIYADTWLGLFPFRRNLTFHAVDLGLLTETHPEKVRDLVSTVFKLTADGVLPMPQRTHYPLTEAATAIRLMSTAEHTGKLVLDIPGTGHSSVMVPPEQVRVFRPDGAYLVTGGLGGLGLFLAEKMAAAGCGRIVLTSRSQPDPTAQHKIEQIRAAGSDIVVECGDIAEAGTAEHLVAVATATGLPVRGVLHAAAVVEDATLTNITDELIEHDWAPKVGGAWNVHQATSGQPLDWFCLFSSAAALMGSPGQGAYAAANSWLDAFSYWRRAQGLPATAIAWGAWADIGRATALAQRAEVAITPDEGAYAFETLLRHDRAYSGYAPILGTAGLMDVTRRSPFARLFQSMGPARTSTTKFRMELNALPPDERPTRLRRLVAEQINLILRRTVDPDRPLLEYGLDSLGYLELRNRIEAETGIRINPTDSPTVRALAQHLCDKLTDQEQEPVSATS